VSGVTGMISSITNKERGVTANVKQEFLYYDAWGYDPITGNEQASGAYIFRPVGTEARLIEAVATTTFYDGGVVQAVRQSISPWLSQTIRLGAKDRHLEFHWTVGSIPIDDNNGKEVITRFTSDLASDNTWYTDSNGREMIQRIYNERPTYNLTVTEPVAGNYYPINAAIFVKDSKRQLTILTDRPQGGASLNNGALELMIHRRLLRDDQKGVAENLNETEFITYDFDGAFCQFPRRHGVGLTVSGVHYLLLDVPQNAAETWRPLHNRFWRSPIISFTTVPGSILDWSSKHILSSSNSIDLPLNVDVASLYATGGGTALLRLAHAFAIGEDDTLAQPVKVSILSLFPGVNITSAVEVSLTGNQLKSELEKRRQRPKTARSFEVVEKGVGIESDWPAAKGRPMSELLNDEVDVVTINPMEIRTFQINYIL